MIKSAQALVANEPNLFAFQEPGSLATFCWGEPAEKNGPLSLAWRMFHSPRAKKPSFWQNFPETAEWNLRYSEVLGNFSDFPPSPRPRHSALENPDAWASLCRASAEAIQEGRLQKTVPARCRDFALEEGEYRSILEAIPGRLFGAQLPRAFRFLVKSDSAVFFGASPELLFRRRGNKLLVPAIAGTRALFSGAPESALREELFCSTKDREEHALVVQGIMEALSSLGLKPKALVEPEILRAPGLLHLHTPVEAEDRPELSSENLIAALHPTPAIAGYPRKEALELLYANEDWDRGLFASPLLFRKPDHELCVVAIRSGLLTKTHLRFFAGAGYVRDSKPDAEWQETARKIQVQQDLLFGANP
jgi:isochorismate synthase EntC